MAPSTALTTKVATGTPHQLDNDQILRASSALLKHIKTRQEETEKSAAKKTLIGDNDSDDEDTPVNDAPVWLILTTKKHIVDKNRLKPGKITLPHSLNNSPSLSVCLISADPQRTVKDVIADPAFPPELASRITKVIGYSKLKARYQSFESKRQLHAEHDVFLADDRIITRLVDILGKIFYKSSKRPIPIRIAQIEKVDGKRVKKDPKQRKKAADEEQNAAVASPTIVAKEIERTLQSAAIHLAPATTSAVRVGAASFTPEQLVENVDAVVNGMTEKFITKGWRNVKAVHIKGANTMSMPIWLASELWVEEDDVLENVPAEERKAIEDAKSRGKKRKTIGEGEKAGSKKSKTGASGEEAEEAAARKTRLQAQKSNALEDSNGTAKPAKKRKSLGSS